MGCLMSEEEENSLIEENMWLIEYVARNYVKQADWGDMISAGRYGLMRGVRKFDKDRGIKASTYLVHWVRAEIIKCLYEDRNVHLPWNRINKYIQEGKRTNFNDGIYPRFEISIDSKSFNTHNDFQSDEDDMNKNDNIEFQSSLSSDYINNLEKKEENDHIIYLLEKTRLTDRERKVIDHRFGLHGEYSKTLKEVGEIMGYSAMGIQKIEKNALSKLRRNKGFSILNV